MHSLGRYQGKLTSFSAPTSNAAQKHDLMNSQKRIQEMGSILNEIESKQSVTMQVTLPYPAYMATHFNIFQLINFRAYEWLPRWEESDPDPIFLRNQSRPPMRIAWHSRYRTVYPHSLQYMALRYITTNDIEQLVPILKNPQFDIDAPIDKKYSLTALQYAATTNKYPIIELLLMHGANINKPDKEGNTPLMLAVSTGSLESINSLMKNGCDRTACNAYGHSAVDKALTEQSRHIADFIAKYPNTDRKFPKFRVRLDIEKVVKENPTWEFIKRTPIYSRQAIVSPFNNFKGEYRINLIDSKQVKDC